MSSTTLNSTRSPGLTLQRPQQIRDLAGTGDKFAVVPGAGRRDQIGTLCARLADLVFEQIVHDIAGQAGATGSRRFRLHRILP